MASNLTGSRRVRAIRPAFDDLRRLLNRTRHRMEVRKHALKLRYWPEKHPEDDSGQVLDMDWSWVRALPGMKIGELRIGNAIGGCDNLRIIFFVGDAAILEPLPMIWILRVMQKKRNEFTAHDLEIFRARRTLVIERFYGNKA